MVVGSSEPSRRAIRSRRRATCRSCSSICFLCVSTASWASFCRAKGSSDRPLAHSRQERVYQVLQRVVVLLDRNPLLLGTLLLGRLLLGRLLLLGILLGITLVRLLVHGSRPSSKLFSGPALHFIPDFNTQYVSPTTAAVTPYNARRLWTPQPCSRAYRRLTSCRGKNGSIRLIPSLLLHNQCSQFVSLEELVIFALHCSFALLLCPNHHMKWAYLCRAFVLAK